MRSYSLHMRMNADGDLLVRTRVTDGIVDNDHQRLTQPLRIGGYGDLSDSEVQRDADVLGGGERLGIAAHLLDEFDQGDNLHLQTWLSRVRPGDKEEIVDQSGGVIRLIEDASQRSLIVLDRFLASAKGNFRFAANDRERRAKLVADVGKQPAPGIVRSLQSAVRILQFLRPLRDDALQVVARGVRLQAVALQLIRHRVKAVGELREFVAS